MRNRAQLPQKAMASTAHVTPVTPEQPTSTPNMLNDQLHQNRDNTAESKPHGKGKGKAREENPAGLSWGASEDTHMATQAPTNPLQVPTHMGRQPPKKKKTRPQGSPQVYSRIHSDPCLMDPSLYGSKSQVTCSQLVYSRTILTCISHIL